MIRTIQSTNRLIIVYSRSFPNAAIKYRRSSTYKLPFDIRPVPLPSLSPTMTHGSISSWKKQSGDKLIVGDVLCDIETDKASVALEIQDEGYLAKILVNENQPDLAVGSPIALVVDNEESLVSFKSLDPSLYEHLLISTSPNSSSTNKDNKPEETQPPLPSKTKKLSPAARHIVQSKDLDVAAVKPSGGRLGDIITKSDVINGLVTGVVKKVVNAPSQIASSKQPSSDAPKTVAISQPTIHVSSSPVNDTYRDIPNSNMRKVISKRLTESKATVPHLYLTIECNIDQVLRLRKELKKNYDLNVSVNDLVVKSVALALRDVPVAFARWDKSSSSVTQGPSIDISVAVATPTGLITPIVTNADKRGLVDINATIKDLATRARDGKLKPEEYQGGAFSVSNLGMYGINVFSAVINPPQSCILAVGSGIPRVVPPKQGKSKPSVETFVTVQLSADRRVLSEDSAALFLQVFRDYLNEPRRLML